MTSIPTALDEAKGDFLEVFVAEMERVVLDTRGDEDRDTEAASQRKRMMEAIALTIALMRKMKADPQAVDRLTSYYAALNDLSTGKVHPILTPMQISHKPPASSDVWRTRATLAIALDYLVQAGIPLSDAATKVSKVRGIVKVLDTPTANAKTSLKNWRVTIDNGAAGNDVAQMRWKSSRENLWPMDSTERQRAFVDEAERLIKVAEADLQMIIPRAR